MAFQDVRDVFVRARELADAVAPSVNDPSIVDGKFGPLLTAVKAVRQANLAPDVPGEARDAFDRIARMVNEFLGADRVNEWPFFSPREAALRALAIRGLNALEGK